MRGARGALALVVALQLVAETAMTPYWPRLLRTLFGVEDLAATGTYLTVCRIAGLAALPLWGLAARRWPLPRLLIIGLVGSAVFDLGLALAPSLTLFTALSAGVVATGSSLVLAYPALVAVGDRGGDGRVSAVVTYAAVFHAAAVVATVVGAGVVALPEPRLGLAAFAVADVVLAVVVWRAVPVGGAAAAPASTSAATAATASTSSSSSSSSTSATSSRQARRGRLPVAPIVAVTALAVLVDLGATVPRPFFTELVLRGGNSLALAAVLFLLPATAALAALPLAGPATRRWGEALLPLAGVLATAGLGLQAVAGALADTALPALAVGRVVFGLGLGLVVVGLDLRVFAAVGTAGPGFTAVETGRSAALLGAPVIATAAASASLSLPLLTAAVLMAAGAALAALTRPTAAPSRPPPSLPSVAPAVAALQVRLAAVPLSAVNRAAPTHQELSSDLDPVR